MPCRHIIWQPSGYSSEFLWMFVWLASSQPGYRVSLRHPPAAPLQQPVTYFPFYQKFSRNVINGRWTVTRAMLLMHGKTESHQFLPNEISSSLSPESHNIHQEQRLCSTSWLEEWSIPSLFGQYIRFQWMLWTILAVTSSHLLCKFVLDRARHNPTLS